MTNQTIYLDNAATTPIDPDVVNAMTDVLQNHFGNPSAQHAIGRDAKAILEISRKKIAKLINALSHEIVFTSGGTEADNMAIRCSVNDLGVKHIITSAIEHHAVLHTVEQMQEQGKVQLHFVQINTLGQIDYLHLEQLAKQFPNSLITLMHANNEIGTMIDLKKVSTIAKANHCYFHSDTVQTIGHYHIDVSEIGLDFLTCSAHKFNGPKGVGFLYVNHKLKINSIVTGGGQEKNLRAGTENIHGIVGLTKALEISNAICIEEQNRLENLKNQMINLLKKSIEGIEFNGCLKPDESLYTILNCSIPPNPNSEVLLFKLDMAGICASGGSACNSGASKGSHVLAAIKHPENRTGIRFSFGKITTEQHINQAVLTLKEIISN